MTSKDTPQLPHKVPPDMKKGLSDPKVQKAWKSLTPLSQNEWICWVTYVKTPEVRKEHIRRAREDLLKGKRRPCCWPGCMHRTDKRLSPSQKFILSRRSKKR